MLSRSAVLAFFFLGLVACSPKTPPQASPWSVSAVVAPGPFHGIHGLGYDHTGQLLAGSVVGAATYAVDRESGAVSIALPAPDGMADDLALAPDGTLAWTGFLSGTLWVQAPGEAPRRIASGLPGANSLAFNAEGRLFFTQVFLGDALYEADLTGASAPRLIMEGMGGLNGFEIGPDGALYGPLWFKGQIARVDLETETLSVIADGFAIPAAVNFDSKGRLFAVDTQRGEVLEVNREGGPHRLIAKVAPAIDNLVITPDDQIIISNMADNALIEINPDTGATRVIVESGLAVAGDIATTEDGTGAWVADVFSLRRVSADGSLRELARQYAGPLENPLAVGVGAGEVATSSWSAGVIQRFDATTGEHLALYHNVASPMDVLPLGGDAVLFLDFLGGRLVEARGAHLEAQRVIAADLAGPVALVRDGAEHVLVSERDAGQVRRLRLRDGASEIVVSGLTAPEGLTRSATGSLLVADVAERAVFEIDAAGRAQAIARDLPIGFEAPPGTPAAFIPTGLATLADGTVLLTGDRNASVLRLSPPVTRAAVVLYEPEIPPNTGNVIRLCALTGAPLHLIAPLGFELDDRRLRRAGLDYHEFADVRVHRNLDACLSAFDPGRVYAFTTHGSRNAFEAPLGSAQALVFGPETRGLPTAVLARFADAQRLRLPQMPGRRSLNLSNAVAISVFEAWRQQGFSGAT